MKPRFPLSRRILLLAAVNVVLLFALLAAFIQFELGMNLNEVLFAPAQDRALSVGREVAVELDGIGIAGRDALLARYKQNYGAEFYLFQNTGGQIAGPSVTLPAEVSEELTRQPPPGRGSEFGRPPPPRRKVHRWIRLRCGQRSSPVATANCATAKVVTARAADPARPSAAEFFKNRPEACIG